MDADVIVIGLGAAGSWAAWDAAASGADVIGVEASSLLHDDGAYAGESRLFRAAYHEGADYVPLLLASREAWVRLDAEGDRTVLHPCGVLSIGAPSAPQLEQVRRSLASSGIPHELLGPDELRSRYPQHGDIVDEIGVLDLLGGALRPEAAVAEIQRRARGAGADLRGRTPVERIEETNRGVRVMTPSGVVTARRVIVSAGVWSPMLLPQLAGQTVVKPLALTWFAPDDPAAFAPEVFPGFIRDRGDVHVFGVPSLDGSLVKAGYDARLGDVAGPDALERRLSLADRERIARDVHRLLPALPAAVSRHSVHADLFTRDKRALIGAVSDRIVVGTAFSGHGFKLTPAFGEALADLALARPPRHDVTRFAPQRLLGAAAAA
jgi:sarcosine oxidase